MDVVTDGNKRFARRAAKFRSEIKMPRRAVSKRVFSTPLAAIRKEASFRGIKLIATESQRYILHRVEFPLGYGFSVQLKLFALLGSRKINIFLAMSGSA